ncbi:MAG: MinD/ParA family protein [Bacillota bacterium]|nr:MinD/ParA family protein [Bacillota bacterium]
MDQAQRLREIVEQTMTQNDARVIAISSGKGGVGKTNISVNLAIALSRLGKKVTIIDADLGLSNVDVLFGVLTKYNLVHVLNDAVRIQDIVVKGPNNINIVSGGSGIIDLADIDDLKLEQLILSLGYFNSISDYILLDTGAGIGKNVKSFVSYASELIVVVTPDPTSITDAYALIKNVVPSEGIKIKLIVNRVESNSEGEEVFSKLSQTVRRFLQLEIENLGYIFDDSDVKRAVRKQVPLLTAYPRSLASKAIENIAFNIENNSHFSKAENGFRSFLQRLIRRI